MFLLQINIHNSAPSPARAARMRVLSRIAKSEHYLRNKMGLEAAANNHPRKQFALRFFSKDLLPDPSFALRLGESLPPVQSKCHSEPFTPTLPWYQW